MKNRNRFSYLLKHLMTIAKLKNSVLAKALRYDESYISKWVTGTLLPTEKASERVFRDISQCIVLSLDEESRETLYSEYQVHRDQDLEDAIFDNLEAEFNYVVGIKESGSGNAAKAAYYPELTIAEFINKMRHPTLRQVKSLDVILAADILALDQQYLQLLSEFSRNKMNVAQFSFPGVHFSLLIHLDPPNTSRTYNALLLQNLLANLANIDFQLYSCPQSRGKTIFTVKNAYALSGLILDEGHCFSVTATEDPQSCNVLYDKLATFCAPEHLVVRHTTFAQMQQANEYMQHIFSRNQCWIINHVTEHLLSETVFEQLAKAYCQSHTDADFSSLMKLRKMFIKVQENTVTKVLLNEERLNEFVISGTVDFFGEKMTLSPQQRLNCLEHLTATLEKNQISDIRILRNHSTAPVQQLPPPTLFLSDTYCYMRIHRTGSSFDLSVLCHPKIRDMFRKYYDGFWEDESRKELDYQTTIETIRYLTQMVQMQIFMEEQ